MVDHPICYRMAVKRRDQPPLRLVALFSRRLSASFPLAKNALIAIILSGKSRSLSEADETSGSK
jgi:hypothetical protein